MKGHSLKQASRRVPFLVLFDLFLLKQRSGGAMPSPGPWDLRGGGGSAVMPRGVRLHVGEQRGWERSPACGRPLVTLCSRAFQGKVHLELRLSEVITDTGVVCHKLATR